MEHNISSGYKIHSTYSPVQVDPHHIPVLVLVSREVSIHADPGDP